MSQLNVDYQDGHWEDSVGSAYCGWCGRATSKPYLFPIVFHMGNVQQIAGVCLECIAHSPSNSPDYFAEHLPLYDAYGNKYERHFPHFSVGASNGADGRALHVH
jgi:hypothetical protein